MEKIIKKLDIKPAYEHSKFGTFMFNLCAKWTKFMVKHRVLYYILACTGGILATLLGWIITAVLGIARIFTKNIHFEKYYGIYDIKAGPKYWGGFEMGLMFVRDQESWISVNAHEFGHTFQNTLVGPLMFFIVSIPSAIRYWYQVIREYKGKDNKPYDSIGFEDSATQCGEYAVAYLKDKSNKKSAK